MNENLLFVRINGNIDENESNDIPFKKVEDLYFTYHLLLNSTLGSNMDYTTIDKQLMYEHFPSLERLHEFAMKNTQKIFPAHIVEILGPIKMYAVTNVRAIFGATALFYPHVFNFLADKFKTDFYCIPSSIHEFLIIPKSEDTDSFIIESIIHDVNYSIVNDQDRLSDHLYEYNVEAQKFSTVK